MKIMLIDDEPFALKILGRQLNNLGYQEVLPLEDPRRAMELLERDPGAFAAVLLDLQMPELDGVEFVRHLVRLQYPGDLILVSGEDERILHVAEKLARAHGLRVLGTLRKPVKPDELRQVLEQAPAVADRSAARPAYSAAEVQEAISRNELVNYYQPQVEMGSGRVVGVEALVRWQHPRDGLIFPDQFIGIAEEHGLIDDLTRLVLAAALQQARRWHEAGLSLQVAVNVSMDNLVSLDFADYVAGEVLKARVPLAAIVLEVTESRLMKDPLTPLDILARLRLKQVRLSIDDFGTGHSSLAQLRNIPFDELKVDRSFVHGAHSQAALRAIAEASFSMARNLGMKTVAEGIEDRADWDFIRAGGCDLGQGYFVAKPMPATEVSDWLPGWEPRRRELIPGNS